MRKAPMAVVAASLLGCASQPQDQQRVFLTEDQLRALLAEETTVRFDGGGSVRGVGIWFQEGTARLTWDRGGAVGNWRIQGDKFCTIFPTLRRGQEFCSNLQKTGEKTYTLYFADGTLNATWEIQRQQQRPAPTASSAEGFGRIQVGMSDAEVLEILASPDSEDVGLSGRAFNPFYYGPNQTRATWTYKGQGQIIFDRNMYTKTMKVVRVIRNPNQP